VDLDVQVPAEALQRDHRGSTTILSISCRQCHPCSPGLCGTHGVSTHHTVIDL
jgi:hypothetical protein